MNTNRQFLAMLVVLMLFFMPKSGAKPIMKYRLEATDYVRNGAFPLIAGAKPVSILVDGNDAAVVSIVANALAGDLEMVAGARPKVISSISGENLVIAGTLGCSVFIDELIRAGKIEVSGIRHQWETYLITTVEAPLPGVKRALVVAGADRRGTAYGLFELSRLAGVSPWVWWADVKPKMKKNLFIDAGTFIEKEPDVKFRGIFLNDEDWGLQPWAAQNMDREVQDIGPKTYARIFELMLRLRANTIWPAMHDSTKPFWYYKENPAVADKYAIVLGSTHCDMLQRSNTYEWQVNYEKEYGTRPGPFRYDSNQAQVYQYWNDRVADAKNYESVYTIGMRGVRDGGMKGPNTTRSRIALLDTIIADQRTIFKRNLGSATVPQIFCPYKEVLGLYKSGLQVPDDVTLVWTDDNFGYLRQLSTPKEQKRRGASGVYYHLSYMGKPHDYLWLSSIAPPLISYEMTKAISFGANRFWMLNVGDIKPGEMEISFFLDMAWDVKKWSPERAYEYTFYWAGQQFGKEYAFEISAIKNEYYRLAQTAKPEHTALVVFDSNSKQKRLTDYHALEQKVDKLKDRMPAYLKSAFFELIEYPVKAASLMNKKVYYASASLEVQSADKQQALYFSRKALAAFEEIQNITRHYNQLENGKWKGMITAVPRDIAVYGMPPIAVPEILKEPLRSSDSYDRRYSDTTKVAGAVLNPQWLSIPANAYKTTKDNEQGGIVTLKGLGLGGNSISRREFNDSSFSKKNYEASPSVTYEASLKKGRYRMVVKCLPTRAIHEGRGLNLAVSVNGGPPEFAGINLSREGKDWSASVLRGFTDIDLPLTIDKAGATNIRVYLMDTGLVLSRIDIEPRSSLRASD